MKFQNGIEGKSSGKLAKAIAEANAEIAANPIIRTAKGRESCRHPLTTDQMVEAGKELAASQIELRQLDDDFKSVRDEWKSRISAVEARLTAQTGRISRGYDIKETECTITFDTPDPGLKTCARNDTGERVWVREMTDADKQLVLDLDDEATAGTEGGDK